MSLLGRARSRLISAISRSGGRPASNVAADPSKETCVSSSIIGNQPPQPPIDPPTPAPTSANEGGKRSWSFLKYGLVAALTGGTAAVGYATYAYSADEIDQKTESLRSYASYTIGDDASLLDKAKTYAVAGAMTVPAKLIEVYLQLRRLTEEQVRGFTEPTSDKLLPDLHPLEQHVFTLVLDLNETLIFSDWKRERGWRTFKRPGVDAFIEHLGQFYEIVVYSDQLSMYVDPIIERLDKNHFIRYRLSRGATKYINGKHYRDLSMLNRDPNKIIYLSGHALESCLQPENSVPIKAWKGEADDTTLLDLIPFLEYVAKHRPSDIRRVIASYQGQDIAKEFIERSKEIQRKLQDQKQPGRFWKR